MKKYQNFSFILASFIIFFLGLNSSKAGFTVYESGKLIAGTCPVDMVSLPGFCMDRYEAPNEKGAFPLAAQTAIEGEAWCKSKGKRLCSEQEWVRACQGRSAKRFPYGDRYEKGKCNDDKLWRVPNWDLISKYPKPEGVAEVKRLYQADPSGSRQECVSDEGIYDLTGNTTEWVTRSFQNRRNYNHVMKGCYWVGCYENSEPDCFYVNSAHPGKFRSYEAGFRCCLDAQ